MTYAYFARDRRICQTILLSQGEDTTNPNH